MSPLEFDARVNAILAELPDDTVAISIRDPHSGFNYDRNADRLFHAASTMKVPVMIEVFRQADLGVFNLDDSLIVENAFSSIVDGSPYSMDIGEDSDESVYGAIGTAMSIRDLIHQMITRSSNLATNLLIDLVSADSVQTTIRRLGTTRMEVLRGVEDLKAFDLGMNNTATSADLAVLLEAIANGEAVSDEADAEMVAILSEQEFNEMIPAGLPEGTIVAHKTGSITRISHDAAIVSPDDAPWVIVILTEGFDDQGESFAVGQELARLAWSALRAREEGMME